jgi:hypothetical protein
MHSIFKLTAFFLITLTACRSTKNTPQHTVQKPETAPMKAPDPQPASGAKPPVQTETDAELVAILAKNPVWFQDLLRQKDSLNIQIIYTKIDRQANNHPVFTTYKYNVGDQYFYPASTVKLPTAVLSLQRLRELKVPGLQANSTMITEAGYAKQTPVYNDPTTPDGKPSIAHYIKKIALVSDNDAYNRLYEFLGQEYLNNEMHKRGMKQTALVHRLEISMSEVENRHTNPVRFLDPMGKTIYQQAEKNSQWAYPAREDFLGSGYQSRGSIIQQPMNFSQKNRLSLEDLTQVVKSVLFPQAVPANQRFDLAPEDYQFLQKHMSMLPRESRFPAYDTSEYNDAYVKFLLFGSEPGRMPDHIRIFNKVGDAYGFLIDAAYIVDFKNKVEFMLSAVIYCNADGILNDNKYDYNQIGYPFMKQLGQCIYDYELSRTRKHKPDLSAFQFNYE